MARLVMYRIVVAGRTDEVRQFRELAAGMSVQPDEERKDRFWKVRPALSFVSLAAMLGRDLRDEDLPEEASRVWLDSIYETPTGLMRATYKLDVRGDDPTGLLIRVSRAWPRLIFVIVSAEPARNRYAADLLASGRRSRFRLPHRQKVAIGLAKYREYQVSAPEAADADEALVSLAEAEADWARMDACEAHWERRLRKAIATLRRQVRRPRSR